MFHCCENYLKKKQKNKTKTKIKSKQASRQWTWSSTCVRTGPLAAEGKVTSSYGTDGTARRAGGQSCHSLPAHTTVLLRVVPA